MNQKILLIVALWMFVYQQSFCQEMDKELTELATRLATQTRENAKKKVAILDFTDLDGKASDLGKYIAEQLTVDLVLVKSSFSVVDRANLNKILAEHKLTQSGLVDPENVKKLGQFAGVDALIFGNVIRKNSKTVAFTAKIVATDTAEIVGAAKAEFTVDESIKAIVEKPPPPPADPSSEEKAKAAALQEDKAKVVKTFGDLRVEVQSLKIVNGNEYLLALNLVNQSPKKSLWTAIHVDGAIDLQGAITDSKGYQYVCSWRGISGIEYAFPQGYAMTRSTEIQPTNSISTTLKFFSRLGKVPSPGVCQLRFEVLSSNAEIVERRVPSVHAVSAKIEAE